MENKELAGAFIRFNDIVAELREKCPWDRKQTKDSLRHLTIEETYELADAILKDDWEEMKIELGDLFLHILFYALIGTEKKEFSLLDVINSQIEKLIRRHPHVYGEVKTDDEAVIKANWEQIKAQEKALLAQQGKLKKVSTLDGVPQSLPSMIKAQRMQEKAANVGFDWEKKEQVWAKVREEISEFEEAKNIQDQEGEMGDLLFALVNYCRLAGINADDALSRTNRKFQQRFEYIEEKAESLDKKLVDMSLNEMEAYWQEAKTMKKGTS